MGRKLQNKRSCRGGLAFIGRPNGRPMNGRGERMDEDTLLACFRPRYARIGLTPAPKALPGLCRTSKLVLAGKIGRRERIRTSGPYVPNVVLYQAELLSEPVRERQLSPREAPL
jgi:hypothetical protein